MGHETRILAPTSGGVGESFDGHLYQVGTALPLPSNGSTARITLSPFILSKVREFVEGGRFDVVHAHEPLVPVLPPAALLFSTGINVGTFHAARTANLWYLYTKAVLDAFHNRLDVLVAVSEAARSFADDHFPGEYQIVPNGISLTRFSPEIEPLPELVDGRPNILFLGRYNESRKGFIYLLEAMPAVWSQFPEARLVVVGHGNPARYERQLAQAPPGGVVFAGVVDDAMTARYYASSDIFCAPSTGRESFGIVLLEALASGTPVVASNIPGYRGVIDHGTQGILVKPKDEQEIAVAIVRLLADAELSNRLRANGLEHVQQFSWPRVAGRLLHLYEQALEIGPRMRSSEPLPELLLSRDG